MKIRIIIPFIVLSIIFTGCSKNFKTEVTDLNVKFISTISRDPIFSWKISSKQPGFKQKAYQILISDNPEDIKRNHGNIWDGGRQNGDNQQVIFANINQFQNGKLYYVKVFVWNASEKKSTGSKAVRFFIPLNYPENWTAKWITYDYHPDSPLPVFRFDFRPDSKKRIEYARLCISAPGFYEAYLNGKQIGRNVLDPGQTNYEDYTFYSSYEIDTDWIAGENILGVIAGNGWYNQNIVWGGKMSYGHPVVICQLMIQYADGHKQIIATDDKWRWKPGPITYSNIYGGETYDANLEVKDWFDHKTSDDSWKDALLADNHPVELFEQFADPVRRMDSLDVLRIIDKKDGKYIFDFGQNFAGWTRLSVRGEKGQRITMCYAEVLDSANNINPGTTGVTATKVIQTATYICRGEGLEVWEPRFTYFGFRFVEVSGLKAMPSKDLLKGIVVYSSLPQTGYFNCSEENINKLHQLAIWTIKSNIHSIPTDCPHREKCGWTGDAHALAQALIYNYNAQKFLTKYMFDIRSSGREEKSETYFSNSFYDRSIVVKPGGIPTMIAPGRRTSGIASPDWGTAVVQLPWYLYLYYGDISVLKEFYQDMRTWVEYIHSKNINGIITHGLGDWCPPQGIPNIDCPVPVSSTAFHILDVDIMKQSAGLLGRPKDSEYFSQMLEKLKQDFNNAFYDTINHTYGSQTADAMALDMGIVPLHDRRNVASSIVRNINEKFDGFISTGIFGLSRIFKVLSKNGLEEDAFKLLSKKGYNSFAFMWEKFDATTLWEVLPLRVYNERSHNHPMQAGYDAWFYSGIGGITPQPDAPGFKKIVFKPYLTRQLESAETSYESGFGIIKSSWYHKNGKLLWEISIPENSEGKIFAPVYGEQADIKMNGQKIDVSEYNDDFVLVGEYSSGDYLLEVEVR